MKFVRKILVNLFGLKGYLRLISKTYIICISYGLMRKKYAELFFIRKIVKPGDVVLDIGANLAYYSFFLAISVGKKGKVLAVEPIPLFAEVWKKNMRSLKKYDFELFNCALGSEAKDKVKMSIPIVNGVVRHGLTKVDEANEVDEKAMSFEVPMRVGDELIQTQKINQLNFIKCDVEGFEQYVIPSLKSTIKTFLPILQIELGGEQNRLAVVEFLTQLGYHIFILNQDKLAEIKILEIQKFSQDFYFIHTEKLAEYQHLIQQ